jgi:hypothetical protein
MRTGFVVSILFSQLLVVSSLSQALAGPCVAPPLTDQAIADFKSNPKAVIAPDADARTVEALVRDLAGTDATLAVNLVSLASGATPRFRTAIAAGLAQAAVACTNIDQHASLLIQQAVAGFEDGEFQNAFAAVAGDLSTAATEAAFSSATGAVGSVIIVNPNKSPGSTKTFGGGGSQAFFQIPTAAVIVTPASATTPPASNTSTAGNPVSATR